MKTPKPNSHLPCLLIAALITLTIVPLPAQTKENKPAEKQRLFDSPEAASKALVEATKARDHTALHEIFGPEGHELVTGDKVLDAAAFEKFCTSIQKLCHIETVNKDRVVFNIGPDNWPFPIPLMKKDGKWFFDTDAGKEEIVNRHIGENELNTIKVCRAYVVAQLDYAGEVRDDSEVRKYAQKMRSSAGKKDGLYWDATEKDDPSPLAYMVAEAEAQGYEHHKNAENAHQFHGYVFKILTKQSASAPGGAYNYVINGNMIAGFAMIAYPESWGKSGVMTFIINQQGKVYERNFGEKTAELAAAITEYDPDKNWSPVENQDIASKQ